jgi:hypothetical protein
MAVRIFIRANKLVRSVAAAVGGVTIFARVMRSPAYRCRRAGSATKQNLHANHLQFAATKRIQPNAVIN